MIPYVKTSLGHAAIVARVKLPPYFQDIHFGALGSKVFFFLSFPITTVATRLDVFNSVSFFFSLAFLLHTRFRMNEGS